jgi:murein DD-endopeptidase MepM/ murein hydrolase activator NlpD
MRCSSRFVLIAVLFLTGCFGHQKPAPVSSYGRGQGAGSAGVHTVVGNETLWNISNRYKIAMQDIALANDLRAPFALSPGQRLRLPPPQEYKVRPGDSLYRVSRMFNVNVSDIAQLNSLQAPHTLKTGQVLRLPSASRAPARAVTPPAVQVARVERAPLAGQGRIEAVPLPEQSQVMREPQAVQAPQVVARAEPKTPITAKTPKRASSKFMRPVEGRVISGYGTKPGGLHNDGINIAAPRGAAVKAADNGVIVYAGSELKGSGNLVLIRHEGGWMTAYAHMDEIKIRRGDVINRGDVIGTVGATGSVDAPQLHFEVRRGTEAINPQRYLEG